MKKTFLKVVLGSLLIILNNYAMAGIDPQNDPMNKELSSYELKNPEKVAGFYAYKFKAISHWQAFQITLIGDDEDDLFDLVVSGARQDISLTNDQKNTCWITDVQKATILYSPPYFTNLKTHCVILNVGEYYLKVFPHNKVPKKVYIQKIK